MEIQHAMFFYSIEDNGNTLKNPINKIGVSDASHFEKVSLPLIITFFGGDKGKHDLVIRIVPRWIDESEITIINASLDWPTEDVLLTRVFSLEFKPKFHTVYDFLFEVDGKELGKIPLPIIKEQKK